TALIAPMTTKVHRYPFRVLTRFQQKQAEIALDQIRSVDKVRLLKKLGHLNLRVSEAILQTLVEMFTIPQNNTK
ncbi:MAG TPA: transcriptional regulator, partial [Deltaproteobacteria bacterium]|nr:transcriptional regulator [Deltaproteobacteria bacterium]